MSSTVCLKSLGNRSKHETFFAIKAKTEKRKQALRRMIVTLSPPGRVDFDKLCDLVLVNIPEPRTAKPPAKKRRQSLRARRVAALSLQLLRSALNHCGPNADPRRRGSRDCASCGPFLEAETREVPRLSE